MAQKIIDVGSAGNDGTGDTIRIAGNKLNDNFTEVFDFETVKSDITFKGNNIATKSSNADLVLKPSGTGTIVFPGIKINDNNINTVRTNDDIRIVPSGSGKIKIAGVGFSGTTLSSDDSTIININENLSVDGTIRVEGTATIDGTISGATGSQFGTIDLSNGQIVDFVGGSISFGDENLSTTGTLSAATGSQFGQIDLLNGTINDSSGAISFGNENLSTTGTLDVSGLSTFGSLTSTGSTTLAAPVPIDNITINDNIISTSSNANLRLSPGGTGVVNVSNLTIDSSFSLTDNVIKVIKSNADLELKANGTGKIVFDSIDLDGGSIDNVVIGGTTPAAGTFSSLSIGDNTLSSSGTIITDNTVKAKLSNDNIEFTGSGTGSVVINGFTLPNSDGATGQFLRTDGSNTLTFETVPIALGETQIQDAQTTIGFSELTERSANTANGSHESITNNISVVDEFDQSKYDSAWYYVLQRHASADSSIHFSTFKKTIAQGTEDGSTFDAFDGVSHILKTQNDDKIMETSSDIRSAVSKVRFKGKAGLLADSSVVTETALSFWRVGLGDNDSSGFSDGVKSTIVVADLDSAEANLDTFGTSTYRGAKYFVSVNNTTTNEVQNSELIVVHNGSDAFIQEYNTIISNSASTPLATFSADISGGNVRVRGANGTAGTCRVTMYRIALADDESDSSGTFENVIGAQTVSNTASTTIDTNSFRGTASPDTSSTKVINSFAKTDFDSVWYHMAQKDVTNDEFILNKLSVHHGVTNDGSTEDAFITDSSIIKSGAMNDISAFDVALNGSNVELKATGASDGSTTIQNALAYFAVGLGPNTTTATSGNIGTHAGVTSGGNNETKIDNVHSSGTTTNLQQAERTVADFNFETYDSAWYFLLTKDTINNSFETQKISLQHNNSDAFVTSSSVVRTDVADQHPTYDADINVAADSTTTVRLRATDNDGSSAPVNTLAYYRIGLGDDDSSGFTDGTGHAKTSVTTVGGIIETEIDDVSAEGSHATLSASGSTTVSEFTAGTYDGALYFVVNHDVANGSFETQKISIAHNLQDSFMTSSSVVKTDVGDEHPIYTTDMVSAGDSTSKIRLRSTDNDGSTVTANNTMAYYRIGSGDGTGTGFAGELNLVNDIVNTSIIDSSVVNLNTFTHTSHVGAKYFITVVNQNTGECGNIEALVTHDGTDAYITTYNEFFTGNNSLISLTADLNGTSLRLRGSATSGDSTKVIVNRIVAFGDSESEESNSDSTRKIIGNTIVSSTATEFDSFQASVTDAVHYVITGQKGSDENFICEAVVVTDGTNVFVSQGPNVSSKSTDMLEISATISSGTVSVKASSTSGSSTVQAFAVRLKAPTSSTATIDSFSKADFRGAKYFISINNLDTNEVSNIEALVVHDGTNAYINEYNEHFSGSRSLITLTADVSGSNVRLRGVVTIDNTRVTFYRIILSDGMADVTGGTNVNVIGDETISSAVTTLDTFDDTEIDGAHYVIVGNNSSEGASSIQEATVVTDGTNAFVSSGPFVSSKDTNQIDLTASHDGSSTVTLSASSTSGGSTKVNAYRIHLKAPETNLATLDSWAKGSFRGAKYYISAEDTNIGHITNMEALVVHDGTDAYISTFNEHNSHISLIQLTADIDSSNNVRLLADPQTSDVKIRFYRIRLADNESDSTGTDFNTIGAVTVSSSATAIDSFVDSSHTGAHYVIVGHNSSEASASISTATVVTNGTTAFVAQGPEVSTKDSAHLTLTAAHDGSNTVTLSAASTSGASTTVNAFRIHLLASTEFTYDVLDTFAHGSHQGVNYIVVGKNGDNESQIADLGVVTDGTSAFILQDGPNISTHSTTTPLMNFSTAVNGDNVELRATNNQENTDTVVNIYKLQLARAAGNPSSIKTLDTFSATTFRSAKYTVSISDSASGDLGLYETCDVSVTHDGSNAFLSVFGRTTNHTGDLVTFSADIDSGNVRLRGTINNTNAHTVTVVRKVMNT